MKRDKKIIQRYRPLILCIIFYILAIIVFTIWSNHSTTVTTLKTIDDRLQLAALSLKHILAEDFHDRATDPDSISFEEEMRNRKAVSSFAFESELEWLYTLVEKDGKFFFSAPSVTDEEAQERKSWYFYPYEDIPEEFVKAFQEKKTVFNTYTDQWGIYRSAAVPQTSPGGRTYLACADYNISDLKKILHKNLVQSILTAFYFLLASIPFVLSSFCIFHSYNKNLRDINRQLIQHKEHLEELVEERTSALHLANDHLRKEIEEKNIAEHNLQIKHDNLQKALNEVKTLSDLLPICSYCKKIRDDQGYWNQLEDYIEDHSSADFSHSICPSCFEIHFPGKKIK